MSNDPHSPSLSTSPVGEELPELEGAALEELDAGSAAPADAVLGDLNDDALGMSAPAAPLVAAPALEPDPFADAPTAPHDLGVPPSEPLPTVAPPEPVPMVAPPEPVPMVAAPAASAASSAAGSVSAKDLTDDILGGVDFNLPSAPQNAAPAFKPVAPLNAPGAAPAKAAPSGFKPVGQLFGQSGGFGAAGVKPAAPALRPAAPLAQPLMSAPIASAPIASAPLAASAAQARPESNLDARSLFGDMGDLSAAAAAAPMTGDPRAALRAALTADSAPANLPPEAQRLAFHLCRVLVKKGILSIDELLSG